MAIDVITLQINHLGITTALIITFGAFEVQGASASTKVLDSSQNRLGGCFRTVLSQRRRHTHAVERRLQGDPLAHFSFRRCLCLNQKAVLTTLPYLFCRFFSFLIYPNATSIAPNELPEACYVDSKSDI